MPPKRSKRSKPQPKLDPFAEVIIKSEPVQNNPIQVNSSSKFKEEPEEDIDDDNNLLQELDASDDDDDEIFPNPYEPPAKIRKNIKHKTYTVETLKKAVEDIKNGMKMWDASKLYKIPHSTLKYQKDRVVIQGPGSKSVLTDAEEKQLVEFFNESYELGDPMPVKLLMKAAGDLVRILNKPGFKNAEPTRKWHDSFSKRHPDIKVRKHNEGIDHEGFYGKFYDFIERNELSDLLTRSDAFYIIEDTNFDFFDKPPNSEKRAKLKQVLANKFPGVSQCKSKESATVTYTFSADGRMMQPLMIFKNETVDMMEIAVADQELNAKFLFSTTADGGMTIQSLRSYLQRLDQNLKDVQRPIFFFLAETLPRIDIETFQWMKKKKIYSISFIPSDSSVLRKCSEEIFGMNNTGWAAIVKNSSVDGKIGAVDFMKALIEVHRRYFIDEKIRESFKQIGIFPFDVSRIGSDEVVTVEQAKIRMKKAEDALKNAEILKITDEMKNLNEELRKCLEAKGRNNLVMNTSIIKQQLGLIESACGKR